MNNNKYINKLKQCQNHKIVMQSCGYDNPKSKHVKGYVLDKFYSIHGYNNLVDDEKI